MLTSRFHVHSSATRERQRKPVHRPQPIVHAARLITDNDDNMVEFKTVIFQVHCVASLTEAHAHNAARPRTTVMLLAS